MRPVAMGGEWGHGNVIPSPPRVSTAPLSVLRSTARVQTVDVARWRHARALDALDTMPRGTRRQRAARVPVADLVRRMPRMTDAESARALLEVLRLTGE